MKLLLLVLIGVAVSLGGAGRAAASDIFPYPVTVRTLPNGLRVAMVPFDSPGIIAYYTIVRVGSRNEVEPGLSGFAHFFEHMMFRGTPRYSTEAYNDLFKVLGSDANAYTSDDVTVYHALFGSDGLEQVIDAESDRFMNLSYSEADFIQESKAVLGEYNKNFSNPIRRLFEKLRDTAYDVHTYKHTTMGFVDDIVDMPNQFDYSLQFFERWYTPSNTVLLIVGDFEIEPAWELINTYYGEWDKQPYQAEIPAEPAPDGPRTATIEWEGPTLPYLAIGYRKPAYSTDNRDNAALDILAMLAFDETSPLYQKLVIDEQLVEYVRTYSPDRVDPGLFTVYSRIKEVKDIDQVRDAIFATMAEAAATQVDAERLDAVKSHLRYDLAMSLDTASSVASHLTHYTQLTGDPEKINDAYRRYAEVTPADIQRVAATYLTPDRSTTVTLIGGAQ